MLSVERTVYIPNRAPTKLANVDFPVPEVPASRIITFIFDYISIEAT